MTSMSRCPDSGQAATQCRRRWLRVNARASGGRVPSGRSFHRCVIERRPAGVLGMESHSLVGGALSPEARGPTRRGSARARVLPRCLTATTTTLRRPAGSATSRHHERRASTRRWLRVNARASGGRVPSGRSFHRCVIERRPAGVLGMESHSLVGGALSPEARGPTRRGSARARVLPRCLTGTTTALRRPAGSATSRHHDRRASTSSVRKQARRSLRVNARASGGRVPSGRSFHRCVIEGRPAGVLGMEPHSLVGGALSPEARGPTRCGSARVRVLPQCLAGSAAYRATAAMMSGRKRSRWLRVNARASGGRVPSGRSFHRCVIEGRPAGVLGMEPHSLVGGALSPEARGPTRRGSARARVLPHSSTGSAACRATAAMMSGRKRSRWLRVNARASGGRVPSGRSFHRCVIEGRPAGVLGMEPHSLVGGALSPEARGPTRRGSARARVLPHSSTGSAACRATAAMMSGRKRSRWLRVNARASGGRVPSGRSFHRCVIEGRPAGVLGMESHSLVGGALSPEARGPTRRGSARARVLPHSSTGSAACRATAAMMSGRKRPRRLRVNARASGGRVPRGRSFHRCVIEGWPAGVLGMESHSLVGGALSPEARGPTRRGSARVRALLRSLTERDALAPKRLRAKRRDARPR